MDRQKLEKAILEKAREGKIPCAVCFKMAEESRNLKERDGKDSERDEDQGQSVPIGLF